MNKRKIENVNDVSIQLHPRAVSHIIKQNLNKPTVLVNLAYRMGSGGCCGGASKPAPHVSVLLVEDKDPGTGYKKVETTEHLPIYFANPLHEIATTTENPLMLDARGVWKFKQLKLEGLDLSSLSKATDSKTASCH
jgi:hypothetical protein